MTFSPCPKCAAPITQAHHVNQGMGGFTYVIRCSCGLMFDTGAQSEGLAMLAWNERPARLGLVAVHQWREGPEASWTDADEEEAHEARCQGFEVRTAYLEPGPC